MSEERFTNREIKLMFESVDVKLDSILEQTKKTNGRVNKLEEKTDSHGKQINTWKAYIAVIGAITGLVGIGPLIELLQKL